MLFLFSLLTIASFSAVPANYFVSKVYYNGAGCATHVGDVTQGYDDQSCRPVGSHYERWKCKTDGKLEITKFTTMTCMTGTTTGTPTEVMSNTCVEGAGGGYSTKYLFDCTTGAKQTPPALSGSVIGYTEEVLSGVTGTECPGTGGTAAPYDGTTANALTGTCMKTGASSSVKLECVDGAPLFGLIMQEYSYSDTTCTTQATTNGLNSKFQGCSISLFGGQKTTTTFVGCSSVTTLSVAFALVFALFSF